MPQREIHPAEIRFESDEAMQPEQVELHYVEDDPAFADLAVTCPEDLEVKYREDGSVTHIAESDSGDSGIGGKPGCSDGAGTTSRGYSPDAPF